MKRMLGMMVAAGVLAAGCGGGGETVSVWKVSRIVGAKPASCYRDGRITDNTSTSTTIQEEAGTWEILDAAEGDYQLAINTAAVDSNFFDDGRSVLDGTRDGDVYTFDGTSTVTRKDDIDAPRETITTNYQETIALTVDGDTFTGKWTHKLTRTCAGPDCSPTYNADNPNCTTEDTLKGTRVAVEFIQAPFVKR